MVGCGGDNQWTFFWNLRTCEMRHESCQKKSHNLRMPKFSKPFKLPTKPYIARAIRARTTRAPRRDEAHDDKTCAICLESFEAGEFCTVIRCGHAFHASCERAWMAQKPNGGCAVCRDGAFPTETLTDQQVFVTELLVDAQQSIGPTQLAIMSDLVSISTQTFDETLARQAFDDTLEWTGGDLLSSMTGAILWRLIDAFVQTPSDLIPHVIRGRLVGPEIARHMVSLVLETTYDRERQEDIVAKEFYSRALRVKLGYLLADSKQTLARGAPLVCMGVVVPPEPAFEGVFRGVSGESNLDDESYEAKRAISDMVTLKLVTTRGIDPSMQRKIRQSVPKRVSDEVYENPIVMAFVLEAMLADEHFLDHDDWLTQLIKTSPLMQRTEFCLAMIVPSIMPNARSRYPLHALVHESVQRDTHFKSEVARLLTK